MADTTVRTRVVGKIGPADDASREMAWSLIPATSMTTP
jgi:hypothetical protein